jgi:hypothetical protein
MIPMRFLLASDRALGADLVDARAMTSAALAEGIVRLPHGTLERCATGASGTVNTSSVPR